MHRLHHLEISYASEIGKAHVGTTMDELCARIGQSPPTVSVAATGKDRLKPKEKIVIDLTEDEEMKDPELARALRNSLKASNKSNASSSTSGSNGKENGRSTPSVDLKGKGRAPPTALPQTVVDALDLDERPLDLSHFCSLASNGEVGEETLLRSLRLDELKEVARAMKVFKPSLTVRNIRVVDCSSVRDAR